MHLKSNVELTQYAIQNNLIEIWFFLVEIMTQKLKTITQLCSMLITQLILISCSTVTYEKIYPTLGDGKYDSEFPYIHSSEELQKITETVQRINSAGFYKTYLFKIED